MSRRDYLLMRARICVFACAGPEGSQSSLAADHTLRSVSPILSGKYPQSSVCVTYESEIDADVVWTFSKEVRDCMC